MNKYTRHHYIFAKLVSVLKDNIQHSCYLIDTYPNDPRTDFELSMLNVYEKLYNLLTGSDDVTLLQEDYETMLRVVKESEGLYKKGFQKIKSVEPVDAVEPVNEVTIAQTQVGKAPELVGNIDTYVLQDQLHAGNMEEVSVVKKGKKVKTS